MKNEIELHSLHADKGDYYRAVIRVKNGKSSARFESFTIHKLEEWSKILSISEEEVRKAVK